MPFGWGGFDAAQDTLSFTRSYCGLQCLSAGGALMPRCQQHPLRCPWGCRLQCLSAGGALMPNASLVALTLTVHRLQCLSAGGALMPRDYHVEPFSYSHLSPMPFGWGGFDAMCHLARWQRCMGMSPMPFGWGGFDAQSLTQPSTRHATKRLQCLSAGGALMPRMGKQALHGLPNRLQCLSAGGALMPETTTDSPCFVW